MTLANAEPMATWYSQQHAVGAAKRAGAHADRLRRTLRFRLALTVERHITGGIILDQKYALITGASSGIGRSYAMKFASLGFNLVLVARNASKLKAVSDEISAKHNRRIDSVICDLSVDKQVSRLVSSTAAAKNIMVLVNSAGYGINETFANTPLEKTLDMMNVHIHSAVRLTKAVLPNMLERNEGTIINVSSLGSFIPLPKNLVYSATKSFINSFSENLSLELESTNIIVQAICPGYVRTGFYKTEELRNVSVSEVPKKLWMEPDELVEKSIRALSKRKVIYVPGFVHKAAFLFRRQVSRMMIKKINRLDSENGI